MTTFRRGEKINIKQIIEMLKNHKFKLIGVLVLLLILGSVLFTIKLQSNQVNKEEVMISYNHFLYKISQGEIISVTIDYPNHMIFAETDDPDKVFLTTHPRTDDFIEMLLVNDINVNEVFEEKGIMYVVTNSMNLILMVMFILFMLFFFKKMNTSSVGESYKAGELDNKINMQHIAGNHELKDEIESVIDFLKNPLKYRALGARVPKGIIFYGPPGTGKTLTAKAIAGEAEVNFFSICGSDFDEMYVGIGASRVRKLFKKARKESPCIIFIDELDALGGKRNRNAKGFESQTINAFLKELDGFTSNEGILVIGATNRVEELDEALIRPGRFDKFLCVTLPNVEERIEMLKLHSANKKMSKEIDLSKIAEMTNGFSGADLENLLNEAAFVAGINNKNTIEVEDIDEAYFKVVMKGNKKKNYKERKKEEKAVTAYHEAGHALVAKLLTDREVSKVTIIPSTSGAGGATFLNPLKTGLLSREELINEIKIYYAGRASEEIFLGCKDKTTTGAQQDIKQATELIKMLVESFGMTEELGLVDFSQLLNDSSHSLDTIIKLSKETYGEAVELLLLHRDKLDRIAAKLIEKETIDGQELDSLINCSQGEKVG